ncbi:putative membrane protein [Mucilaginibacter gracilis]|uniref:Putative membrane protein n=1 Tax=Mucilaginibacter gracilis TaxID=423350 RepID=A0A495IXJ1_9SPHI|nr:TMEM175 family protein [Mucilaginibacter gracilis]RKR81416.1 putative membrane protein [Mucilaginibacter gracilis]
MHKGRLEALSDGVIAIIITIMVLEMKVPHTDNLHDLKELWPVFLSYILSFIYVGIYWNNHHHMMQAARTVNGAVLWANLHLLFWLSLVPFASGWLGENHFTAWPMALYGFVLMMNAIAYSILVITLLRLHGKDSLLGRAIGKDWKGRLSVIIYAVAIVLTCVAPWLSLGLYVAVAGIWLVPDRRIESKITEQD